ncbi:MAG TPA: Trk family potassium uptake protein [Thermoanaerobacterales bacterium]|nr:Trk family potassium uptake protein [Thermoanaerobacterales bacterium]
MHLKPTQILTLGFAITILVGALLLNHPAATTLNKSPGFINALFTATSAICVTGLTVVDTGTYWSMLGKTVILILIQIGGLGFMTTATMVFLLLGKKITLRERLVIQEALNQFSISGVVRLVRYILLLTMIIEAFGAVFLSFRFIPQYGISKGAFYSVFHSVSAFNNAGFDIMGDFKSLTQYNEDILVNIVIMSLIILGGLGFSVLVDIINNKSWNKISLHSKLVIFLTSTLIVVGSIIIFILEFNNPETLEPLSFSGQFISSLFHAVSPRTAGFNTLPTDKLRHATQFFTMILMFIGGSPASTAGGIKTTTFGVLLLTVWSTVKGQEETVIYKRTIPTTIIFKSLAIISISLILISIMTLILTITEKAEFMAIIFEVFSAFGTVGLSLGLTHELTILGKILIIILMFTGRVGPLTLTLAFSIRAKKAKIKYPEEKILVG